MKGCPNCDMGISIRIGENKFKVTSNVENNSELAEKLQDIVDKNVTCGLFLCLNCFKVFADINYNEKQLKADMEELSGEKITEIDVTGEEIC